MHSLTQLDSTTRETDIKEAFALHDKRGNGTIASSSLGDVLRALGQNPTQKQVQDLVNNAPQESESRPSLAAGHSDSRLTREMMRPAVDYDTFVSILNRPGGYDPAGTVGQSSLSLPPSLFHSETNQPPCLADDFIAGFQVFDKEGNGYIGQGEFRYILTTLGEPLSDHEVDELLKDAEITPYALYPFPPF